MKSQLKCPGANIIKLFTVVSYDIFALS